LAALLFIFIGLILAGFGGIAVLSRLISPNVVGLPAMACEGFLAFLGILAMIHGYRSLNSPGKV
jgi:hypothetical protein